MTYELLHFATDDKFIPLAIDLFESAFPGQNRFRLLRKRIPSHFVSHSDCVTEVQGDYFTGRAAHDDVANCRLLVIHGLRGNFVEAINRAPSSVTVVWCGWGFDYYPLLGDRALLPLTAAEVAKASPGETDLSHHPLKLVAKRLDVCSVLPTEIDALRAAVPELTATLLPLRYYNTEDTFAPTPTFMSGPDILLGNSADPTNNHLDALETLSKLELGGARLVVPLSYGGTPDYVAAVCARGRALFGDRFISLEEFVPLEEFNRLVTRCGIVVMNHRRQQALGTTSQALYRGAKLYLRPESPVFRFYTLMGVTMARWEPEDGKLEPIAEQDAVQNRRIIGSCWSRATALEQLLALRELCR